MLSTRPITRSIVTSSRHPTRRFSPCSPIAGSTVTRHASSAARARRTPSPPTVAGAHRPQRVAAAGSPRWKSRCRHVNVDRGRRAGGDGVGPVLGQLGHQHDARRPAPARAAAAGDDALHRRGPRRRASGSSPPSSRPPDGRLEVAEPLGQAVLGDPAGGGPRQALDDPRQARQDGAGAEQDGDEHAACGRCGSARRSPTRGPAAPCRGGCAAGAARRRAGRDRGAARRGAMRSVSSQPTMPTSAAMKIAAETWARFHSQRYR